MNSFGLGLVLNFTDHASTGMNNAAKTFMQMSDTADAVASKLDKSSVGLYAVAQSMSIVGDTFMGIGSTVMGVFGKLAQKTIDVGGQMLGFRMQLSALYGEAAGEAKLKEIQNYAAKSVFEVESLMKAVTTMKAVGIEAMDDISTSSGKNTQKLMDYASDLAAMMPEMRNVYGTGVNAAMGAFKEYIAEGNAVSLKRGAGLDITQILGEDKADTIEARTQQIADLIEKLNIVGYTAALYGTPSQRISNMNDVIFNSFAKIAESGVFEVYSQMLEKVSDFMSALTDDEETFNAVTGVLADTVITLMKPLNKAVDVLVKFGKWVVNLTKTSPALAKGILLVVAAVGGLLVGFGALLKLSSSIYMLSLGLQGFSKFGIMFSGLAKALGKVKAAILPIIAIGSLLYIVWKKNLFGIRDLVQTTFKDIGTVFSLVSDAFDDNTLSYESFEQARKLGILPLIEALLDLKYYLGVLADGFSRGFSGFFDTLGKITQSMSNLKIDVFGISGTLGELLKSFTDETASDTWEKIGEALGVVAGFLLILLPLITAVKTAFKLITPIISLFKGLGAVFETVKFGLWAIKYYWVTAILPVLQTVGTAISGILTAVAGALGISVGWLVAIIAAVVAVVVLVIKYWDNIVAAVKVGFEAVKTFIGNLIDSIKNFFISVAEKARGIIDLFVAAGRLIYNSLRVVFYAVLLVIKTVFDFVKTNIIDPVVNWIGEKFNWLKDNIFTPVADFFKEVWQGALEFVQPIIDHVVDWFTNLGDNIHEVFSGIGEFISGVWDGITESASAFFSWIGEKLGWLLDGLSSIGSFFAGGIGKAADFVGGIGDKLKSMVGLSTGGYVKTTGVAVLHPNEVVVNDPLTKRLGLFLDDYAEPNNATTPTPSETGSTSSTTTSLTSRGKSPSLVPVAAPRSQSSSDNNTPTQQPVEQNDYSVTFAAGSIVIQLSNASDAELEKAAEKLMKIIERKQQLKQMATRK